VGTCNIDHSNNDVMKKFQNQKEYLPETLIDKINNFLEKEQPQEKLNDLFHLLKKYDLASAEERDKRNEKLTGMLA